MRDVGIVKVTVSRPEIGEKIFADVDRWLIANNWRSSVDLECQVVPSSDMRIEIAFVPGEFQSNGPKTLAFKSEPDLLEIEKELASWLHQLENPKATPVLQLVRKD